MFKMKMLSHSHSLEELANSNISQLIIEIDQVFYVLARLKPPPLGVAVNVNLERLVTELGDKAEVARIILGQSSAVDIHTGNIINWNMLKKQRFHPSMTSSDELMDGLHYAMQSWKRHMIIDPLNIPEPQDVICISNNEYSTPIDLEQREKLKLSVKLFLCNWRAQSIRQAVDKVISDLGVKRIDSLIVSFPISPSSSSSSTLENIDNDNSSKTSFISAEMKKIKPIWVALQSAVDDDQVKNIGVCDFDQDALEELLQWARIKPAVNQISLDNCCAVPTDLIQYSREKNVELLTHNDPPEILSSRAFQSFVAESTNDLDASNWTPTYIARYSVLVRCRGIVHSKGYIMSAEKRNLSGGDDDDYGFF